jgi:hypothetical protein
MADGGHLYRRIEAGLARLCGRYGEPTHVPWVGKPGSNRVESYVPDLRF